MINAHLCAVPSALLCERGACDLIASQVRLPPLWVACSEGRNRGHLFSTVVTDSKTGEAEGERVSSAAEIDVKGGSRYGWVKITMQLPGQRVRVLRILLIEDDPIDAAWITELIRERAPGSEVVHSPSLHGAWSVLIQRPIDTVFINVRPDGEASSTQDCRELMRRAGKRPVVALVNLADMAHAAEVRAAGASFIYCKHPIWRTAEIRKRELRTRLAETSPTHRPKLLRNPVKPKI